jgi:hypothetical protein
MHPAPTSTTVLLSEFEQLRSQLPVALIEVEWPALRVTYMNLIAQTLLGYASEDVEHGIHALSLLDAESQ